ncbi:hypothetical protein ACFSKW_53445 [Nonomuraea mangrovi]|uniref:Uncharacterized protein n=1 Tax=Nonomuraea mangrovi TaxID=2316207 RepID=A0ABW4TE34_9ACTN
MRVLSCPAVFCGLRRHIDVRPDRPPELRLITCGGGVDERRHGYRDNLVVYAA